MKPAKLICLLLLTALLAGCASRSSKIWTRQQVLEAFRFSSMRNNKYWWPKEIGSNQFHVITWDGKYLRAPTTNAITKPK